MYPGWLGTNTVCAGLRAGRTGAMSTTAPTRSATPRAGSTGRRPCRRPALRQRRSTRASRATGRGAGSRYRDANGATIRDAEERRADRRARDSAGLDGRLDLREPARTPAGDRPRRARPQAVPLPPGVARRARRDKFDRLLAFGERAAAIRARRRGRSRAARPAAREGARRGRVGSSTRRSSASATRSTRARTDRSALTTLRDDHVDVRGGELRAALPRQERQGARARVDDPRLARVVRRCQRAAGPGAVPVHRRATGDAARDRLG